MRKLFPLLLILVFALAIVFGARYSVRSLTDGLVLWLPFEEGTGNVTHDASGHGNDGVIKGNFSWAAGKKEQSLEFNGSGYVELNNTPYLQTTNQFTISAWVKPSKENSWYGFYSKGAKGIWFGAASNMPYLLLGSGAEWQVISKSKTIMPADKWKYVTATYNHFNGEGKVYLNGNLEATSTNNQLNTSIWKKGLVKVGFCPGSYYMYGSIDELRVYNRTLSQEEIRGIMEGRKNIVVGGQSKENILIVLGGLVVLVFLFAIYQVNYGKKLSKD